MSENNNEKSLLELAKEHQLKCWMGRHKITGKARKYRDKDVNCILCGRNMTAPEWENPPFYCYKCDEEAESVQRDNCVTNPTPPENLLRDKTIRDYEDYYNGKTFKR